MSSDRHNQLKDLAIFAGTSLSVFAGLWTLLDPAGGFEAIDQSLSRQTVNYLLLVFSSLLVASSVHFIRNLGEHGNPSIRHTEGASRSDLNLAAELSRAERRVLLLGISLPSFSSEQALRVYSALLARGVDIEIILVNPFSPTPLQRPTRLYEGHEKPPVTAARTLARLTEFRATLGRAEQQRMCVYVSSFLPTHGIMVVDEEVIWYPYLDARTGVMSPYLRDENPSVIAKAIIANFEELRSRSLRVLQPSLDELRTSAAEDLADSTTVNENIAQAVERALGEEWRG